MGCAWSGGWVVGSGWVQVWMGGMCMHHVGVCLGVWGEMGSACVGVGGWGKGSVASGWERPRLFAQVPRQDLHASDKRQLTQWSVLAVSASCGDNNIFKKSSVARGKVLNVELVRPKDMVAYVSPDPDDLPEAIGALDRVRRLSAGDRQRQHGPVATTTILKAVFSGMQFSADSAVCVVDWHCSYIGDWMKAVRTIQNQMLNGTNDPSMPSKVWGLAFSDTEEEAIFVNSMLQDELDEAWYDGTLAVPTIGRVGPKDMPSNQYPTQATTESGWGRGGVAMW